MIRPLAFIAVVAALAAACAPLPRPAAAPVAAETRAPVTILISIDGFRADYLDRGVTPNLARLAATGVRAAMRPAFPSLTFPNHTTLVTGLSPDRNGIVGNVMVDARRPGVRFTLSDTKQSLDPFWWSESEPLWVTAEKAGVRSATMFWPGSEVAHAGVRAADWQHFDEHVDAAQRVRAVIDWLRRPAATRPRFVTLYFDTVDHAGHEFGPEAPETTAAAAGADAAVGDLMRGLADLGQPANIVVVADHGMAATSKDRVIRLDALVAATDAEVVGEGPYAGLAPAPGRTAVFEVALLHPHSHMTCWRKADIPKRLDYGANPRVPPLLCLADTGWSIQTRDRDVPKGSHGYDNAAPEMRAVFVASGPGIAARGVLADFDNVAVYPLLARLIGVTPLANESGGAMADAVTKR